MTQKVPKTRCKRCRHYNEWYGCHLDDLTPCPYHRELKPWQIYLRIVVLPVAILIAFIVAMLLLNGCDSYKELAPEYNWSAVELLHKQHKDELTEWEMLIMAIAYTESKYNPSAVGTSKDLGILQITPIYVKEINRLKGTNFRHEDAYSMSSSLAMFETMNEAKNPTKDLDLAIYLHNKSSEYKRRVMENYKLIERYETFRKIVKK